MRSCLTPSLAEDATPEAFADAMLLCQGYAPACSDAHECVREGWCFSDDAKGYKAAHEKLEAAIASEPDVHARTWLAMARNAMQHLRVVSGK